MATDSPKEHSMAYPRTFLTFLASVGGLALFLVLASTLLVSRPIGYAVSNYFHGVDNSVERERVVDSSVRSNVVENVEVLDSNRFERNQKESKSVGEGNNQGDEVGKKNQAVEFRDTNGSSGSGDGEESVETSSSVVRGRGVEVEKKNQPSEIRDTNGYSGSGNGEESVKPSSSVVKGTGHEVGKKNHASEIRDMNGSSGSGKGEESVKPSSSATSRNSTLQTDPKNEIPFRSSDEIPVPASDGSVKAATSSASTHKTEANSINSECDLYHGKWVHDSAGPLYTNGSCPVLTQMQNCQGNGRPDKDYENWRWKPDNCDLPRFDPRKFLESMRGKTLAFIGDSVARNQMESMLCILWQVEVPKNRGNRRMHRFYFRSTSTMIVRIWSSWLVHQTHEAFDYAPAGVTKVHLDAPDESFMEFITDFDVVVLSSGHWFAKRSVYILNNKIVGGQLWSSHKSRNLKINNIEAFGISVETILTAMVTHPNYKGLTILRSYSPDHYEGGAWNTGGSCTGKVKPATDNELVRNDFTNIMHEKQLTGFNRAIKKKTNRSILKYMDITKIFSYRHDGHPGPYRNLDPNKITQRRADGKPPPQDCLHWCMPGAVDTWNEIVAEIVQREFKDDRMIRS